MSPEQASGEKADKRADIWSFGVVLWEMLTGKRLFQGATISHILASVLKDEPDYTQVPPQVRPLLRACLQKEAKQQLRDIADAKLLLSRDSELVPGRDEIYVQAFPLSGAKFQISTGGGDESALRNDGTELFYRSADGNLMAVSVKSGATFEAGVPKALFPVRVAGGGIGKQSYAVSNDGQRFLVVASAGGEKSAPMTVVLNWPAGLTK